jgi:response regulator RpfG family c-di-GMP phosphodiesterase
MRAPGDRPPKAAERPPSGPDVPVPAVLVVDDEAGVRDLLVRWLGACGFDVITAASADEALVRLRGQPVAVALCDIRMPGRDGLWLAEQVRHASPDTAVVMATGVQDVGSAVTSLRHGVIDCLMKPFGRDRLRDAVQRGVEWHRGAVASRAAGDAGHAERKARVESLFCTLHALRIDSRAALEALLTRLDAIEPGLADHSHRVARQASDTGRLLDVPPDQVEVLERAALVHELAKLSLPDAVLHKVEPLTSRDRDAVRGLPDVGYGLLTTVPFLAGAAELVRLRHERWDGTGYPSRLRGEAIPMGSRILAVVDSYEAMIHPRSFQPGLPEAEAVTELTRCSGTQFDPTVVAAFLRVIGARTPFSAAS